MEPKPPALADCGNANAVFSRLGIRLDAAQKQQLERDRLLLVPIEATRLGKPASGHGTSLSFTDDEMLGAFRELGDPSTHYPQLPSQARLITPDLVLHAWHRGFSRMLETVEEDRLNPLLSDFLKHCLDESRELRTRASGPIAIRLARIEGRFAAPWVLLVPKATGLPPYEDGVRARLSQASAGLPADTAAALEKEISLILAARETAPPPLFGPGTRGDPIDYTQFKVRSHYTKNERLGGYFRAMMFLGLNGLDLSSPDGLLDAELMAFVMSRSPAPEWREIMEITGFFAGQTEDITAPGLDEWTKSTLGETAPGLETLSSPRSLAELHDHLDALATTASRSRTFRVFGQRFSRDARILDLLASATPEEMPTALMIPAAFCDDESTAILRPLFAASPDRAAVFDETLAGLRLELTALDDSRWFASMASAQLRVISMLARPRNDRFPAFMRSTAFRRKNIVSMLGSYTELKHDTVLYQREKVIYGEGGAPDTEPSKPRGMVQPDVAFWREMERLATFAADGFIRHKLTADSGEEFGRFRRFAALIRRFREIAEKEVRGTPLSPDDWDLIRCADLSFMAEPVREFDKPAPGDGKCALVTQIFSNLRTGSVLQEALGRPHILLVLAGGAGGNRLLTGLAYNHLEFTTPLQQAHLDDQEWQARIYTPDPPELKRPPWQTPPIRPASSR